MIGWLTAMKNNQIEHVLMLQSETLILEYEAIRATCGDVNAHLYDVGIRQVDGRLATLATTHGRVTSSCRPVPVVAASALRHHGVLVARCPEPARYRHRAVPAAARRRPAPGRRPVLLAASTGRCDGVAGAASRELRRRHREVEEGDVDALMRHDADNPRTRRTAHPGLQRHGARQQTFAESIEDHRRRRGGAG